MKLNMLIKKFICSCWLVLSFLSCNQSKKKSNENPQSKNPPSSEMVTNADPDNGKEKGITGEWEQEFAVIDHNDNAVLDQEERNGKKIHLGFDYFKFNADGTCLRDRDIKFKGTYQVEEKNSKKNLTILGGDKIKYTIAGLTSTELILFTDGASLVFKRVE